jgi:hypothetical protein
VTLLVGATDSFLLAVGALPAVSSASPISNSCVPLLLCGRALLGATFVPRLCAEEVVLEACDLGGPGAIGTTPPDLPLPAAELEPPAFADEDPPPTELVDLGDSDSAPLPDVGVVTGVWAMEFLRDDFLDARDDEPPTGAEFPLPRFRFLITSVLRESGRTTPCSFRNSPQALQSGCPSGLRRQSGVV